MEDESEDPGLRLERAFQHVVAAKHRESSAATEGGDLDAVVPPSESTAPPPTQTSGAETMSLLRALMREEVGALLAAAVEDLTEHLARIEHRIADLESQLTSGGEPLIDDSAGAQGSSKHGLRSISSGRRGR